MREPPIYGHVGVTPDRPTTMTRPTPEAIEHRVQHLSRRLPEEFDYVRDAKGNEQSGRMYLFLDGGHSDAELYEFMAEFGYIPDRTRGRDLGSKTIASVLMEFKIHDPLWD